MVAQRLGAWGSVRAVSLGQVFSRSLQPEPKLSIDTRLEL